MLLPLVLLAGYVGWNCYFLIQGRFPVSIFTAVTGLPCPSSGCVRSFQAYLRHDYVAGLLYNPFSLLFVLLLVVTVAVTIWNWLRTRRLRVPDFFLYLWCGCLALAWIAKFALGQAYW